MAQPELIDVSVTIDRDLVCWPGDTAVRIEQVASLSAGDPYNSTKLTMSAHTGTHMDAPRHFIADGRTLDEMPLEAVVGPARVIEINADDAITTEELESHRLGRGERILFRTANSRRAWWSEPFFEGYVHITPAAARYLVEREVMTVGVDYLSIGSPGEEGARTHRIMLGAGIWVIEGLNLRHVTPGVYELMCLPLKVAESDGAPARAFLRRTR